MGMLLIASLALAAPPPCRGLLVSPASALATNPDSYASRILCAHEGAKALFDTWIAGPGRDESMRIATLTYNELTNRLALLEREKGEFETTRADRLAEIARGSRPEDPILVDDLDRRIEELQRQIEGMQVEVQGASTTLTKLAESTEVFDAAAELYGVITPVLQDRATLPRPVTAEQWQVLYITAAVLQRIMGGNPRPHLEDLARMYRGGGDEELLRYSAAPGWVPQWTQVVKSQEGQALVMIDGDPADYAIDGHPVLGLDAKAHSVKPGFHRVERIASDGLVALWAGELENRGLLGLRWTGTALQVWDPASPDAVPQSAPEPEPIGPAPARLSVGGGWSYLHEHHMATGGADFVVPTPGLPRLEWHLGASVLVSPRPVYIARWQDESVFPRLRTGASYSLDVRRFTVSAAAGGQLELGIGAGPWLGLDVTLPVERLPMRVGVVVPFSFADKLGHVGVELRIDADLPLGERD